LIHVIEIVSDFSENAVIDGGIFYLQLSEMIQNFYGRRKIRAASETSALVTVKSVGVFGYELFNDGRIEFEIISYVRNLQTFKQRNE